MMERADIKQMIDILDQYNTGDDYQRPIEATVSMLEDLGNEVSSLRAKLAAHELTIKQMRDGAEYIIGAFERGCEPEDYWRDISDWREIQPSQENLDAWFKRRIGEPVLWLWEHTRPDGSKYISQITNEKCLRREIPLYAIDFKEEMK